MEENVNFDNEVLAYLTVRKDELIESHSEYTLRHPEIREVLNDFISSVLLHKPVSVHLLLTSVERCFCLCKRILPSLQPNSASVQTFDCCRTIRCRKKNTYLGNFEQVWRCL